MENEARFFLFYFSFLIVLFQGIPASPELNHEQNILHARKYFKWCFHIYLAANEA